MAVAQASMTTPSMNGRSRSIRSDALAAARRFEPAKTVIATAPAAIQAGGSASWGSSSVKVQRKKTIVITIRYSTSPRANAATRANAMRSSGRRANSRAPETTTDSVATINKNQVPLIPFPRPGFGPFKTTAKSVP